MSDLAFTGWILFLSCLYQLDHLLILSQPAGSSSDLVSTSWIIFWSWLYRLNHLLILPSLAESSFDLDFTNLIIVWSCLYWLDPLLILSLPAGSPSDLVSTSWIIFWSCLYQLDHLLILALPAGSSLVLVFILLARLCYIGSLDPYYAFTEQSSGKFPKLFRKKMRNIQEKLFKVLNFICTYSFERSLNDGKFFF